MPDIQFSFDLEKAVEAIIFLAKNVPQPTFMAIAKLLYFADKTSLETYGRPITGDTYFAMQHGPVPGKSYDLMKAARDTDNYGFHVEYERHIVPDREPNLRKLSKSDLNCLTNTIRAYGSYPVWQLRELSHDAAWQKAWQKAGVAKRIRIPVEDIVALIDEENELLEFLHETNKTEGNSDT